ncbi:MAG: hypothetical protein ND866_01460 [Pyrinomonadaceae bacterium]|nr:hypothetical protein [Pyrinomonadaceae bacterium]
MDFSYFLLSRLPIILLALVGILLAIARWKRHSKVSLLTIFGLGLFLFQSLTFMFLYSLLPQLQDRGWTYASINHLYTFAQVCQDFLFAGVIILLVAAAFSQRHSQISNDETKAVTPI